LELRGSRGFGWLGRINKNLEIILKIKFKKKENCWVIIFLIYKYYYLNTF